MALIYDSYWHEVTCDECKTVWDSPNGQAITHNGKELSTMDLDCPECADMKKSEPNPEPNLKDFGAF